MATGGYGSAPAPAVRPGTAYQGAGPTTTPTPAARPTTAGRTSLPAPVGAPTPVSLPAPSMPAMPAMPAPQVMAAPAPSLTSVATAAPNPQQQQVFGQIQQRLATPDPLLAENVQNLRNRMSADTTQRAIDRSSSAVTDSLAGAVQRSREAAARSGTAGNYAPQVQALEEGAQRAQAGAAAGIALGREQSLDQLALGAGSAYAAPSGRDLSLLGQASGAANASAATQSDALSQALQAWRAQQEVQLQQQQLQQQQANDAVRNFTVLYNNLWS